jgi:hypothetical protein
MLRLKQFQIVQTDFDNVEIRYVPENEQDSIDLPVLAQRVSTALRHPVNVTLHPVQSIQRSRTGKYEDFISLVGAPSVPGP